MISETLKNNLGEWISAATGIGVFSSSSQFIERFDYDGFQTTKIPPFNPALCHATTKGHSYEIVGHFSLTRPDLRHMPLSTIERSAYNEMETEAIVREIVVAFIRETGVIRMKVHVVKKLFSSNHRASVAVIIEEVQG